MNGFLFDTNVLLDLATIDQAWLSWSVKQFEDASKQGVVCINPVIYAACAPAFATRAELDRWFDPSLFRYLPLPYAAAWPASWAFVQYRRAGGTKSSPSPDFFIGAHAEVGALTIVTRDAARYRTYFPSVIVISP